MAHCWLHELLRLCAQRPLTVPLTVTKTKLCLK